MSLQGLQIIIIINIRGFCCYFIYLKQEALSIYLDAVETRPPHYEAHSLFNLIGKSFQFVILFLRENQHLHVLIWSVVCTLGQYYCLLFVVHSHHFLYSQVMTDACVLVHKSTQ